MMHHMFYSYPGRSHSIPETTAVVMCDVNNAQPGHDKYKQMSPF